MSRLPQPGGDVGNWGTVLNDFLSQVHNTDGTLKAGSVDGAAIAPNAVSETNLGVTGGTDGQVLVKSTGSTSGLAWATPTSSAINDASSTTKGIVQLTGDLGGTAASPTVPGLASKIDTSQKGVANGIASLDATGKVPSSQIPATGGAVTSVATRTGDVVLTKSDVGLANVDNTADASKPISTAVQTALNAKADTATTYTMAATDSLLANKVDTSYSYTLDSLSDVTASGATNGQSLVYNAGTWGPADVGTGGTVVDATSTTKGVLQLTGDLSGTAASPSVVKINGVTISGTPTSGQVPVASSGTAASWGAVNDASAVKLAGSTMTGKLVVPTFQVTGGTPATGNVLTSDASGNATWQAVTATASGPNIVTKTTAYSAAAGDYVIADTTTAGFNVTLPTAAAAGSGVKVSVKKVDASTNAVTVVVSGGGVIDNVVSDAISTQWQSHDYLSNGTQWYLV